MREKLTNVHFPVLPLENITVDLETHSLGLNDVKGFHIFPKFKAWFRFLHQVGKVIMSAFRRGDAISPRIVDWSIRKRWEGGRGYGELGFTRAIGNFIRRWIV